MWAVSAAFWQSAPSQTVATPARSAALCYIGGIAGLNGGTISSAYNTGTVSGTYYIGGIAGLNGGTVTNAYNTGVVRGATTRSAGLPG